MPDFGQPSRRKHPDGIHRDQYKRPIFFVPSDPNATSKCKLCDTEVPGKPFTRMTRFIDVLENKYNLEMHFKRQVAKGLALKEHLVLKASNALNADDPQAEKDALNQVCREAEEAAGSSDKADHGTELHKLVEKILRGQKPRTPKTYQADIEALQATLAAHQMNAVPDDLEVNIVIDDVQVQPTSAGIGGRFDLLLTMSQPCAACGRFKRVADFKTGQVWYHGCTEKNPCGQEFTGDCPKRKDYGSDEFRMQLAGYAMGQRYDLATGARFPLDDVCQCIGYIIHLPPGRGRCELLEADLGRGRAGLAKALDVWWWRESGKKTELPTARHLAAVPDPAPVDSETSTQQQDGPDIFGLISMAADQANIAGLFEHFNATGQWTEEHTQAAWKRIAQLHADET